MANANLTEAEGKLVLDNLGVVSELIPFFKDKFSENLISAESLQSEDESDAKEIMSSEFYCYKFHKDETRSIYNI